MNAVTEMPAPLIFTDAAAHKVQELIDEEGNPALKLRVFVTGGGCSGFQYGFTFDETVNEDDASMVKNGVTLLIDPMRVQEIGSRSDAVLCAGNVIMIRDIQKCPDLIECL